jgi:hypothetical protein
VASSQTEQNKKISSYNSISVVQANSAPFAVIDDSRPQISHQQLTRSGKAWFSFVSLLEALYIVNLTEENAMKHRANIFLEVGKAFRKSLFSKEDRKKMWRMYFVELLPPYVLRGIRTMREAE